MELEVSLIVVCVLVVITNMAVIWMVVFIKKLRTFTNYFVLSLAVSDVLMGGVVLPLNHPWVPYPEFLSYATIITMLSGVGNICAVTWDRYVAVMHVFAYRTKKLERYYKKILIAVWITVITCSLLPLAWKDDMNTIYHKVYLVITMLAFVILPYLVITVGYIRIYARLRHHTKQLKSEGITRSQREGAHRASLEGKTVKVFVVVMVFFLLSWVPVIYMTMVFKVFQPPNLVPRFLWRSNLVVLGLSSLVNPVLYALMKRDFNSQIRRCFRCFQDTPAGAVIAMGTMPVRKSADNYAADVQSTLTTDHIDIGTASTEG